MIKMALAGNPNCGKTTLFNRLTGSSAHVGNWAGVTVERREGTVSCAAGQAVLVDLPGIYALSTYTLEERVARQFLLSDEPDLVICLLDGCAIARGLYLVLQLCEAGCRVVLAIGMMDEARRAGMSVDAALLARRLGIPVIPLAARTGEGVQTLMERAFAACDGAVPPPIRYHAAIERAVDALTLVLADECSDMRRLRGQALALLAGEADEQPLPARQRAQLAQIRDQLTRECGADASTAVADARYRLIDALMREAVVAPPLRRETHSDQIDAVALHPILAYPIFVLVLMGLFALSFGPPGQLLQQWMGTRIHQLSVLLETLLPRLGVSGFFTALLTEGALGGVGSVLVFLPQIALLFFSLTLLEECGYLARAAFLMDLPLRWLGLTGKSFIPMVMGFGCTTPAVMAARTLQNTHDRKLTAMLTPFLPCGARFPIFMLFAGTFFPRRSGIAVLCCYFIAIFVLIAYGYCLRRWPMRGERASFLMEFPPYRMPSGRNLWRNTAEKCVDFLRKAGTVIFLLSLLIWLLGHFDLRLRYCADGANSLFQVAGGILAPLFAPLGFASPEASVALLAGLASKEAVVSTLGVACHATGDAAAMQYALKQLFTPLSAASFLTFCALYTPCVSALATLRRELGSTRAMLCAAGAQLLIAYLTAMAVYQFGLLAMRLFV